GGDHLDPGHSFEILTVQAVAAFAMGFGWAGLGGLNGAGWSVTGSIGAGVAGGVVMTWLLAILLRGMYLLESSGNVRIEQALGSEGEVYASVPAREHGRGQVRVVIEGRQRIYNAVSDQEELPSGSRVRVARVNPDHTLTVVPL
ncbi:MAG: NfeD family protein, partial [Planctomycetes bacterium]|nr:NfeD family protein [Planctomycetota bacterium]